MNTLKANEKKIGSEKIHKEKLNGNFMTEKYNNLKLKTHWLGLIAEWIKQRGKSVQIETENSTKCSKEELTLIPHNLSQKIKEKEIFLSSNEDLSQYQVDIKT